MDDDTTMEETVVTAIHAIEQLFRCRELIGKSQVGSPEARLLALSEERLRNLIANLAPPAE